MKEFEIVGDITDIETIAKAAPSENYRDCDGCMAKAAGGRSRA
ncbi:MAG TPA: hypothetical protein VN654_18860 [Vicinamibacterales bacterium]|nr:hypothetical protein [Vicinamibacterales bacterium]